MNPNDIPRFFTAEMKALGGFSLSEEALVSEIRAPYPSKPYCLVRDRYLVDLAVTDIELKVLKQHGFQPVIVLASTVVLDKKGRFPARGWVNSSYLFGSSDGYIFETVNTVYVLMGKGFRTQAGLDLLSRLR